MFWSFGKVTGVRPVRIVLPLCGTSIVVKFYFTGSRLVGKYSTSRLGSNDGDDSEVKDVSDDDCSALRYVCECISRRAGFMVSAGITALLKKMDYKDVVVAIDGSVFRLELLVIRRLTKLSQNG